MADGTVTGTFRLNTPASRQLRELRTEGERTDRSLRQLGQTMDTKVGGPTAERRLVSYGRKLSDLRRTSDRTHTAMRTEWSNTSRHVDRMASRMDRRIDGLEGRLDALGSRTVRPQIDLTGVAVANTQLSELERRLNRFGRQRAQARVGIGGGFAGGGGGGGGGGGRGGRRFGLPSFMTGLAAKAAPLLLPAATNLIGGAGALVGSAGSAALGGAALGAPALGGLAVGAGGAFAVGRGVVKQLKDVTTAQQAYNKAVAQYGAHSKQAQTQEQKWRSMLKQEPPAIRAVSTELQRVQQRWGALTAPGRRNLAGALTSGLRGVRRAEPFLARAANRDTAAIRRESRGVGRFISGPTARAGVDTGAAIFDENLRSVRLTVQNIAKTFVNVERAARPFFREGTQFTERWTKGWADSTSNITKTRTEIGHGVNSLRAWGRLAGSTFRLLRDVFSPGRQPGDTMVERLTATFDRWDVWARRNPRKIEAFFSKAVDSVSKLAGGLARLTGSLFKIGDALSPLLDRFSELASLAGGLGLFTPGVGALALGGLRGGGRFFGRGGGRDGGGMGGGGGAGGMVAAAALAGGGGFTGGLRGRGGLRGLAGRYRQGSNLYREYGRGARISGGLSEAFGGGAGLARGIIGGAARRYVPLAAAFSALDAANFNGPLSDKIGAGLSTFTMGALQRPMDRSQRRQKGQNVAGDFLSAYFSKQPGSARQARQQSTDLASSLSFAQSQGAGFQHGADQVTVRGFLRGRPRGQTQKFDKAEYNAYIRSLQQELGIRRQIAAEMKAQEHSQRVLAARQRGRNDLLDIAKSYDVLRKKLGSGAAFADFEKNMRTDLRKLGPTGRMSLARSGAQWIKQMRKTGQLTAAQARAANRDIEKSFDKMGQHVRVVNGRVYTGSDKEWSNIEGSLTSHAEQAREKVSNAFTKLQQDAIYSLEAMGYSRSQARGIVRSQEGAVRRIDRAGLDPQKELKGLGSHGRRPGASGPVGAARARGGRLYATGARVPGRGATDFMHAPDGGRWAPGELVVNRHTEEEADRKLGGPGRLSSMVSREGRPQWAANRARALFARRQGFYRAGFYARGGALGVTPALSHLIGRLDRRGFHHGSTTSGGHAANSYHYKGEAVDYGDANNDLRGLWRAVYPMRRSFAELFGPSYLTPKPTLMHYGSGFTDAALQAQHNNHIHMALTTGGARGPLGPGGGVGPPRQIHLRAPRSGMGGAPGALADRAMAGMTVGMQRHVNKQLAAMGGGDLSGFTGGGSAAANRRLGRRMMLAAGWPASQWPYLDRLWTRESGWNASITNKSSGAAGIPQALGHGHVFNLGDAPAQIRWGLRYIRGRYRSPSAAWAHEQSAGWYARGGRLRHAGAFRNGGDFTTRGATSFIAGESGRREDVSIRPHRGRPRRRAGASIRGGRVGGVHLEVHFNGTVNATSPGDIDKIASKVADVAGQKLLDALDGGDTINDEVLA